MTKDVLSVPEVATYLGVSRPLAYELVHRADFPAVKIGERRIVVPVSALESWLTQQASEPKGGKSA